MVFGMFVLFVTGSAYSLAIWLAIWRTAERLHTGI